MSLLCGTATYGEVLIHEWVPSKPLSERPMEKLARVQFLESSTNLPSHLRRTQGYFKRGIISGGRGSRLIQIGKSDQHTASASSSSSLRNAHLHPPRARAHSRFEPIPVMDVETQANLIQKIVAPGSDYAAGLLDGLGLSEPPSRERINVEIEERLLLPKQKLPDHWLPKYQM